MKFAMFTFDPFNLSHTANIFDFDILIKGAWQYLRFIAVLKVHNS